MKRPLIILTGPTAVGKTKLSIALAKRIGGEIVSADSMQVYKYMDIGSAKITKKEMDEIPHHLIDILEPEETFHVARFQEEAKKALEEIYARKKIPIIAGGTGFYIQALLYDIDFQEEDLSEVYKKELEAIYVKEGAGKLYEMLQEVDSDYAHGVHQNNVRRVMRALTFYHMTGQKLSQHNEEQHQRSSPYQFVYFVLNDDRKCLYERINQRVDAMVDEGLLGEVKNLWEMKLPKGATSMNGIGYKELFAYLSGETGLEEAIDTIKKETRHFAKRQITWFKREKEVIWLEKEEFHYNEEAILEGICKVLYEKGIINESNI